MGIRLGRSFVLAALLLACRQEVPLPEVSPGLDASIGSRPRPIGDASVPADADDPSDAAGEGGSGGRIVCNGVSLKQFNPHLVLAVDRSASMTEKPATAAASRQTALQNVLRPLIKTYQQAIYFGYVEFPSPECQHGDCCSGAYLPPSYNTLRLIERRWSCEGQTTCPTRTNDSPVGAALWECRQRYDSAEQIPGTRNVLLFTDGEPACSSAADGKACDEAVKEVAELRSTQRVRTTVVALEPGLKTSACLMDMAGFGSDNPLYVAPDEATLRQQLEAFFKQLSLEACTFRLREPIVPPQRLAVTANGYVVKPDPTRTDGWAFDTVDDTRFTIHGSWCDKLRMSAVDDVDAFVCNR